MQVSETLSEGLKRGLKIVVPSSELEAEIEERLVELSKTVKMKGFRPGKVPLSIIRRQYRAAVMGEVLERTIQTSSQKAIEERELRPAMQPKIEIGDYSDGSDLEYTLDLEILPEIKLGNFSEISLTRLLCEVDDEKVDEGLKRIADADKQFKAIKDGRGAEKGDGLLIDFKGTIEDVELDGTSAEDFEIELGSGTFIPGFEDQLLGIKAGEHKQVNIDFPKDYPQEEAAGKPAVFEVDVKEVRERIETEVDDEMAKRQGLDDLAALTDMVRNSLKQQFDEASKAKLKRTLLDNLADRYSFEVPSGMIDQEFEAIWTQLTQDIEKSKSTFEEATEQSEDEAKKEYRQIAERRVRLGLLLSEIGRQNEISIERDDLLNAALESARGFSQPQQVLEFYRSNPNALERFRAPVFEDKVVAFLTELVNIKESVVDAEELFRDIDEEAKEKKEGKSAAKKKNTKKPAAKKEGDGEKAPKKRTVAKSKSKSAEGGSKAKKPAGKAAKNEPKDK